MKNDDKVEYSPEELQKMYPDIDWKRLSIALGICATVLIVAVLIY